MVLYLKFFLSVQFQCNVNRTSKILLLHTLNYVKMPPHYYDNNHTQKSIMDDLSFSVFLTLTLYPYPLPLIKDTNRKIRKTEFIYICGSKNGSSSSTVNTGEVWGDVSHTHKRVCAMHSVHVLLGILNQNSNTVIYEKCCSYVSFY